MKKIIIIDYYLKKAVDVLRTIPINNLTIVFDEEDDGEVTAIHYYDSRTNDHVLTIEPLNRNNMQ